MSVLAGGASDRRERRRAASGTIVHRAHDELLAARAVRIFIASEHFGEKGCRVTWN
ncbi:hypothetical protein [Burkholderia vietnamiensis]|uniref:hypothetical protein n=1 Tax=Burkholderia vietnamiensis TaxID=60552 RepID=UPI0012D8FD83|nr:hypothetical protein [Burkholderia vietnamiensis]